MAFAGGKVILFGEHAVVHQRPALAAGIALGVEASATEAETDRLSAEPWGIDLMPGEGRGEAADLARAFAVALSLYPEHRPRYHVHAKVGLPGGAGLGCSASLGVAVIHALDEAMGIDREPEERGEISLAWEKVFHGNPSGVDNTMAAVGGIAIYRRGEPLEPIRARRALPLVIAHSGESSSTKAMVSMVSRQYEREPERVGELFDAIETLVENAKLAIQDGDLRAVGQLMDMNQALLSGLMLSTEKLERLCKVAREAGAWGAKLTGAGGGGCAIALCDSTEAAKEVEQALQPHASFTAITETRSRGRTQ